jgi:hypothetical protein
VVSRFARPDRVSYNVGFFVKHDENWCAIAEDSGLAMEVAVGLGQQQRDSVQGSIQE